MGYSVHHVPGRIRFKIPELNGNDGMAQSLQDLIEVQDGVKRVEIRDAASSIIVHYDPACTDIADLARCLDCDNGDPHEVKPAAPMAKRAVRVAHRDGALFDMARQLGGIFGRTAVKVAVEQAVYGGVKSLYRIRS